MPTTIQTNTTQNDLITFIRSCGLRVTPVRLGVFRALQDLKAPIGAAALLEKLPFSTSLPTVYRTLDVFVAKHLIHRIHNEDREWLYAMGNPHKKHEHQHLHFICDQCGSINCLTNIMTPPDFPKTLGVSGKYQIHYAEVLIHGLCPRCNSDK